MAKRSAFTPESARRLAAMYSQWSREPTTGLRYRNGATYVPDWFTCVYNGESSEDCPAFGIMLTNGIQHLGGSEISDYVPKLKRPDTYGCQYNFYVASADGIEHQKSGPAQMVNHGHVIVKYDSADGAPAAGEMWGPRASTFLLKKNTGGFRVLGTVDATRNLVLVTPAPMLSVRGKPSGDIAAAGTDSAFVVWTDVSGTDTSTSQTLSVKNNSSCTIKGGQIARAVLDWDNNIWQFDVGKTA